MFFFLPPSLCQASFYISFSHSSILFPFFCHLFLSCQFFFQDFFSFISPPFFLPSSFCFLSFFDSPLFRSFSLRLSAFISLGQSSLLFFIFTASSFFFPSLCLSIDSFSFLRSSSPRPCQVLCCFLINVLSERHTSDDVQGPKHNDGWTSGKTQKLWQSSRGRDFSVNLFLRLHNQLCDLSQDVPQRSRSHLRPSPENETESGGRHEAGEVFTGHCVRRRTTASGTEERACGVCVRSSEGAPRSAVNHEIPSRLPYSQHASSIQAVIKCENLLTLRVRTLWAGVREVRLSQEKSWK